jgi:hypothetical protein
LEHILFRTSHPYQTKRTIALAFSVFLSLASYTHGMAQGKGTFKNIPERAEAMFKSEGPLTLSELKTEVLGIVFCRPKRVPLDSSPQRNDLTNPYLC